MFKSFINQHQQVDLIWLAFIHDDIHYRSLFPLYYFSPQIQVELSATQHYLVMLSMQYGIAFHLAKEWLVEKTVNKAMDFK